LFPKEKDELTTIRERRAYKPEAYKPEEVSIKRKMLSF
jgi:hypothetical protein